MRDRVTLPHVVGVCVLVTLASPTPRARAQVCDELAPECPSGYVPRWELEDGDDGDGRVRVAPGEDATRSSWEQQARLWLRSVEPQGSAEASVRVEQDALVGEYGTAIDWDPVAGICYEQLECSLAPGLADELDELVELPQRTTATPPEGTRDNQARGVNTGSDPVNPANGEMVLEAVDLAFPGLGRTEYVHRRVYRSGTAYHGPLGHGWDHTYNQRLVQPRPLGCYGDVFSREECPVIWSTGDGSSMIFYPDSTVPPPVACGAGMRCQSVNRTFSGPPYQTLRLREERRITDGGGVDVVSRTWALESPDGRISTFNRYGLLATMADATGYGVSVVWERGPSPAKRSGGSTGSWRAWRDHRIAYVTDSAGRRIDYAYNAQHYLAEVRHADSGLAVRYTYTARGELETATNAQGVTETYGYEPVEYIDPPDMRPFIPEHQLRASCWSQCSAQSGGICAGVGPTGLHDCQSRCGSDAATCRAMCPGACGTFCVSSDASRSCRDQCTQACEPHCSEAYLREQCAAYAESSSCHRCRDDLEQGCELGCGAVTDSCIPGLTFTASDSGTSTLDALQHGCVRALVRDLGEKVGYWLLSPLLSGIETRSQAEHVLDRGCGAQCKASCVNDCTECGVWRGLTSGVCMASTYRKPMTEVFASECGRDSTCQRTWLERYMLDQFGEYLTRAEIEDAIESWWPPWPWERAIEPPCEWACESIVERACLADMSRGLRDQPPGYCVATCNQSCVPACRAGCRGRCETACNTGCAGDRSVCRAECTAVGTAPAAWEARCESQCVAQCVDQSHAGGYGPQGPKYGRYTQLNHNLTHVWNGAGELALVNVYGADMAQPSFDRVIRQWNAGHWVQLGYRDLHAEDLGYVPASRFVELADPASVELAGLDPGAQMPALRVGGVLESRYDFENAAICPECSDPGTCDFGYAPAWHARGALPLGPRPAMATVVLTPHGDYQTYYVDDSARVIREDRFPAGAGAPRMSTWFTYDADGQLIGSEDHQGDRWCRRYNEAGMVIEETYLYGSGALDSLDPDASGVERGAQFRYDYSTTAEVDAYRGPLRLLQTYLPRRSSSEPWQVAETYRYDEHGALTRVETLGGRVTTMVNEPFGRPREVEAPSGLVTTYTYDQSTGTVDQAVVDAAGPEPLIADYDADTAGRVVRAIGPTGLQTTIRYIDLGRERLVTVLDPDSGRSRTLRTFFDHRGNAERVEGDTVTTETEYDRLGFPRKTTVSANDGSEAAMTTCQLAGPGGRVLETIDVSGLRAAYDYDGAGRVVRVRSSRYPVHPGTWDDDCPTLDTSDGPGAVETEHVLAEIGYDDAQRRVTSVDALGRTSSVVRDGFGRVAIVNDAQGASIRYGYDRHLRPSWTAVYAGAGTPYGMPDSLEGGLLAMEAVYHGYTDTAREVTTDTWHFEPDTGAPIGDGHIMTTHRFEPLQVVTTDDRAQDTVAYVDPLGRLIQIDYPTGDSIEHHYADRGRTIRTSIAAPTAAGVVVSEEHVDNWGQLVERYAEVDGALEPMSILRYDERGRLASVADAGERHLALGYDGLGRLAATTRYHSGVAGETVTWSFDRAGRPSRRTSTFPGGATQTTSQMHDWLGRVRQRTRPGEQVESLSYVGPSRLVDQRIDARGVTFDHQYDARTGALLAVVASDGAGNSERVGYERDALGRVIEALDGGQSRSSLPERVQLRYDSLGNRIAEHHLSFSRVPHVSRTFIDLQHARIAYSDGDHSMTVDVGTDALGRLESIQRLRDGPWAKLAYHGLGGPTRVERSSGLETRYAYDDQGRVVSQVVQDPAIDVPHAAWRWEIPLDGAPRLRGLRMWDEAETASLFQVDEAGRVLSESHDVPGVDDIAIGPSQGRRDANQAVQSRIRHSDSWRSYVYDARDNWVEREAAMPQLALETVINAFDGYDAVGRHSLEYDGRGAVVRKGELALDYDLFGRLRAIDGPGVSTTFRYDGLGRLIVERDALSGAETRFAYDGHARVLRKDEDGLHVLVQGELDQVLWEEHVGGEHRFVHQHPDRSVWMITGPAGSILERYAYTAFGERSVLDPWGAPIDRSPNSEIGNRLGFQGHLHEPGSGLIHMRARFYDPSMGRFVSPDPLGTVDGSNLYAFVGNAPLLFADPFGLEAGAIAQTALGLSIAGPAGPDDSWTGWIVRAAGAAWDFTANDVASGARAGARFSADVLWGVGMGAKDTAVGVYIVVRHPIQTGEGIAYAAWHPVQTSRAIWSAIEDTGHAMAHGDGETWGRVLFEIGATVAGVGAASKAGTIDKLADAGRLVDNVADVRRVARVAGLAATKVTSKGLARIERHLTRTPGLEAGTAEMKMLEPLRAGNRTPQDLRFYHHELIESRMLTKTRKLYTDPVDAVREAHHRTLVKQDLYYRGYESELYAPEALQLLNQ